MCSTVSESERPGGRRVALLSEIAELEIEGEESVDVYEGLRGGRGGRDFGGDSKLMSGAEDIGAERVTEGLWATCGGVLLRSGKPFRCLLLWCETPDGALFGPSSTIQSFRSINEVLRPRFGGDGDGDLLKDFGGVNGAIGWNESEVGEIGDSRRLVLDEGGYLAFKTTNEGFVVV